MDNSACNSASVSVGCCFAICLAMCLSCFVLEMETKQKVQFLAHLWGAYAIPVALSGVRHSSSVVRRVSSVSTITTRNN